MDEERFKRTLAIIERVLVPLILGVLVFTTQNAQVRISRAQTVLSQQQTAAAAEQTRLAVWSEKGKELRVLYPKLLEAGGGTRPLRDGGYYHLFDSLHLLCAPFTREPTRRVSDYLVQMAQHARFMRNNWTRLEREYSASFLLSLRLAKLELDYPPTSDESLAVAVRKFRDYLAPNESVIGLTNLNRASDSASILYVNSDSGGLALVRTAGRNVRVGFSKSLHDVSLPEYSAVVIEGAVDTRDTGLLRSLMDQRIGLVLSGQTPYLLAGESQYLGPISDWFGASFLLKTWGSAVTPAANRIFDSKSDKLADLHGLPEWRYGVWALSPAGLSPRTVVVSWCKDDIAVFSAAARPDATHPGRMYYQGSLGEDRYPQLDSLYVSGIRWAAGLLRKN